MQYRRLGSSGLQLSALSFGAWVTFGNQFGRSAAREMVAAAWDHGVNFFDNAENYAKGEAERMMGDVIADLRLPRDGFCVSSKVFFGSAEDPRPTQKGLSRKHIHDACHTSLKRLRVDYLDLYFCHRPDSQVPIAETVSAMDMLVRQGKILYWGTSEWSAGEIREAHRVARAHNLQPPTMEQSQYNLLERQRIEVEYAPLYAEFGIGTTVFSPLASGLLTGKYNDGIPADSRLMQEGYTWLQRELQEERIAAIRRYIPLAQALGVAPSTLALAWCLRNPNVTTVILGASRISQLLQNFEALEISQGFDDATWRQLEACFA